MNRKFMWSTRRQRLQNSNLQQEHKQTSHEVGKGFQYHNCQHETKKKLKGKAGVTFPSCETPRRQKEKKSTLDSHSKNRHLVDYTGKCLFEFHFQHKHHRFTWSKRVKSFLGSFSAQTNQQYCRLAETCRILFLSWKNKEHLLHLRSQFVR